MTDPFEISKISLPRARALQASFTAKGDEKMARRAFQVHQRAARGPAGQRREMQDQSMRAVSGSERGGLGRAGRKRGLTPLDTDKAAFARSDTGRAKGLYKDGKFSFGKADEVSKAFDNHPKVKTYSASYYDTSVNGTSEYGPEHAEVYPKGKTLILRRPKYEAGVVPDIKKIPKKSKPGHQYYLGVQRVKASKEFKQGAHKLATSGKKKGKVNGMPATVYKSANDPFEITKAIRVPLKRAKKPAVPSVLTPKVGKTGPDFVANNRAAGAMALKRAEKKDKLGKSWKKPSIKYQKKVIEGVQRAKANNHIADNPTDLQQAFGVRTAKVRHGSGDFTPPHPDLANVGTKGRRLISQKKARKVAPYVAGGAAYGGAVGYANKKDRDKAKKVSKAFDNEDSNYYRGPGERKAVIHNRTYQVGLGTTIAGAGVGLHGIHARKPKQVIAGLGVEAVGLGTGMVGSHKGANRYRVSQGLAPRGAISGVPKRKKLADKKKVSKADEPKASAGRYATGAVFPIIHGAVAGKKGRKLRAIANTTGGGLAGGALGTVIAGPRGGAVGSLAGAAAGVHRAQGKGHYKKQSVAKSAFLTEPIVKFSERKKNTFQQGLAGGAGAIGGGLAGQEAGTQVGQRRALKTFKGADTMKLTQGILRGGRMGSTLGATAGAAAGAAGGFKAAQSVQQRKLKKLA